MVLTRALQAEGTAKARAGANEHRAQSSDQEQRQRRMKPGRGQGAKGADCPDQRWGFLLWAREASDMTPKVCICSRLLLAS